MATHLTSLMWRLCFHSNLENELLIFRLALLVYMLAIEKAFFMRDRRFCGRGMKTELVSLSLLTSPATSWFNIIHTHTHTHTHTNTNTHTKHSHIQSQCKGPQMVNINIGIISIQQVHTQVSSHQLLYSFCFDTRSHKMYLSIHSNYRTTVETEPWTLM